MSALDRQLRHLASRAADTDGRNDGNMEITRTAYGHVMRHRATPPSQPADPRRELIAELEAQQLAHRNGTG